MTFLLLQSTHRMLLRHDERIGHRFVPGLNARVPNELGGYFVRTNAQGFRSDRDFEPARGARPRILFLGDSYVAGDNLNNAERFSELVGERLGAEVYNYGLPGTGLDQHLLIWEEFASRVEADLVVLAPTVDTIDRIQVGYRESIDRSTGERILVAKPYFTLEGDALALHNVPVPRDRPRADTSGVDYQRPALGGPVGALLDWYRTSAATRSLRRFGAAHQARAQSVVYRLAGLQPYADYRDAASPGWQLLAALLARLFERIAPVPVLLAPIPANPFLTHRARPIYQPLFAALERPEQGVHVLDLTTPMTRGGWAERRSMSFQYDAHFSRRGHRRAAEVIAGEIERKSLLPRGSAPARTRAETASPAPAASARAPVRILGISCFYHDSAACLVEDGRIVAAAAEERFSRIKNDRRFPARASNFCLEQGGIDPADLSAVVYYDNASLTFERLMHSQCVAGEDGREIWHRMLPAWVRFKLRLPQLIRQSLHYDGPLLQEVHHRSHCASAFYPSPFERAAILTVDGVGEWATASIGHGEGAQLELLQEMRFPNSLGLLYSAFTQFTGFKVNSGEYKMMGLAPYGRPVYVDAILEHLVDLKEDGSLELNLDYFGFLAGHAMTNEAFSALFDGPARPPDSNITRREMDLARSIQVVVEEALLRMARHAKELTGERALCLAGGVAFNCVANGRLLREGPFEDLWIQPAAGDAGCAMGAALDAYHSYFDGVRSLPEPGRCAQRGSYWGPAFSSEEIRGFLETHDYPHRSVAPEERAAEIARLLAEGRVVGHFSGRMEYGPRALGARSILGDARNREMQVTLNLKIKYRESFRPFAPTVLAERVADYFELDRPSPYMQLVSHVREERRLAFEQGEGDDMLEMVRKARSDLPAITHVDYSARVQTIRREDHPAYYDLIAAFEAESDAAVVVNTSFNVRGEPIVCTPEDAYGCFMGTEMDVLVLEDCILYKEQQPEWKGRRGHVEEHFEAGPSADDDDPLQRTLGRFFDEEFLPVARKLRASGALLFETEPTRARTTWRDVANGASLRESFSVPQALDTPNPDPRALAAAVTRCWTPGEATRALEPLVEKLARLGLRHPLAEELDAEVEESVYVMF